MRRWNGWGDETQEAHLGSGARRFLVDRIGTGTPPPDADLAPIVAGVPPSRLHRHPLLYDSPELRVRRARGQSFPDWVALRAGRLGAVADAVAQPAHGGEVRALLDLAAATDAVLVPYGGGTSVVGGVTVRPSARPVITVDLGRLAGVRSIDPQSGLVTVLAGTTGPDLDTVLAGRGLVVGHEPQSWEFATVGGWVAARGSGLRSLGQGRIEQLFAGGTLEAPAGTLVMPPFPASAAGPDLRHLVLGSEGRLGILTEVILRAVPMPEEDRVQAWALPTWEHGLAAARSLARARAGLSLLRLSTPEETRTLLAFADRPAQLRALGGYLRLRGVQPGWCLLLVGVSGRRRPARAARADAASILREHRAVTVPALAETWSRTRFRSPYLRNALWSAGYAADTLETATDWTRLPDLVARVEAAVSGALAAEGERVHVFTHLSHVYPSGSSCYLTYLFRLADGPDRTLARWQAIKQAASSAVVAGGGTISHHHGVGTDHAPWLAPEKGPLGMAALAAALRVFDPDGRMNPGVLLPGRIRVTADRILALDVGTQSVRAMVFDPEGTLCALAKVPIEPYLPGPPGVCEQDPERYWTALAAACAQLWAQPEGRRDAIAAVSLTTQRGTVVVTDHDGVPLRRAMVWLDQSRAEGLPPIGGRWGLAFRALRARATVAAFMAEAEANVLRTQEPATWSKVGRYLLLSGHLVHRLTGRFADSVAAQVGYLPFDYRHQRWAGRGDWKWQAVPVDPAWLPELEPPGARLGTITTAAAEATGIPAGLPLIAAAGDKACEVLGSGALEPHVGAISLGTTASINTTHRRYVEAIPLVPPYPAAIPGAYSLEVNVYRGYWMVSWFRREFGAAEVARAAEAGIAPEQLFDDLLRATPPGAQGLTLQPYWSPGVRIPGPEAKGAIVGWGDVHTRAHLYRAILEGLAYALREGAERTVARTKIPITELRVSGGGSQSPAAVQLTADVFGLPASRPHTHETSGLGAAIDAAVGIGIHSSFEAAVGAMTRVVETRDPNPAASRQYDALYRRVYRRLYRRLQPLYEEIRAITGYPPGG